jgi:integrase
VLKLPLDEKINAVRAERKVNLPAVLTREEVGRVMPMLEGQPQLIVKLLYGSGLRILEAVRLRVKDVDLAMNMPKQNGFDVLAWVRAQPVLKRLAIIILTASMRSEDVERAFPFGHNVLYGKAIIPDRTPPLRPGWLGPVNLWFAA